MSRRSALALGEIEDGPRVLREASMARHLPFAAAVDRQTISTRNGDLLTAFELDGMPFETLEDAKLDHLSQGRAGFFHRALGPQVACYHHIHRRRITPPVTPLSGVAFADRFASEFRQTLRARRLYENRQFMSFLSRPSRSDSLFNAVLGGATDDRPRAQALLEEAATAFVHDFDAYGPRRLRLDDHEAGLLSFLSLFANGRSTPMAPAAAQLGAYLSRREAVFRHGVVQWGDGADVTYAAVLSLKNYPSATEAGFLDELLSLDTEFLLSQSFFPLDLMTSLGRVKSAERRMRSAADDAESLRAELIEAGDAVASGHLLLGEHQLSVTVYAETEAELEERTAELAAAFRRIGAEPVRERSFAEAAYWAQVPGSPEYRARRSAITSTNFADIASFHAHPKGQLFGNHWGAPAALLETTARSPYAFNWHHRDRGNTVVFGETGSGKTLLVNALLAMSLHLKPRIFFFDKDRGAEIFLRALGGAYEVVRPGTPTGFNPLTLEDSPETRDFARRWLATLLGDELSEAQTAAVADAVDQVFDGPPRLRRLRHLARLFSAVDDGGQLEQRLAPWIDEGERAWLFDAEQDQLSLDGRISGFDLTAILDDRAARTPWLDYVFHRIDLAMRSGERTMIVLDEAWRLLDDPVFARRLKDWLKTIRKLNGLVVFITQEAEDAAKSAIGPTILQQSPTQIFLPNFKAQGEVYRYRLGLTEGEFAFVKNAAAESRTFLMKHARESVIARLDLTTLHPFIRALSGRAETVAELDQLRETLGDAPDAWLDAFLKGESL